MKAVELKIHNFRSICDATIALSNFNILVGVNNAGKSTVIDAPKSLCSRSARPCVNNAGKSTVIDAVRAFYGKGVKFDQQKDFPCKGAKDQDSWVEIEFKPSNEELEHLKDEYKSSNGTFRVRNYFHSTGDSKKSGLYVYINGELSEERFYGPRNVGQGKFGEIIYIPAVSKIDEHTKLTGPSALRDLINATLSKVIEKSDSYRKLHLYFSKFESAIKLETTDEGYSLQSIERDISDEISEWGAQFKLSVNPVDVDNIIKSLIQHEIFDESLESIREVSSYGQGFQRSIIYALIKVAAKYTTKKVTITREEFSPNLTWILFEEPEAFLHPTQISVLSKSLRKLSEGDSSQILLSTHNPLFATHNVQDLPSFCLLYRENHQSRIFQISQQDLDSILAANQQDAQIWKDAKIVTDDDDLKVDMEAVKYALWLDSRRCSAFFAEKILLVEGPTEVALITYMRDQGMLSACDRVFILDAIGKYNIHRFMRLFGYFGINHCVLYDGDNDSEKNRLIDETIERARNDFTGKIDKFDGDLEGFLEIQQASKPHRKPQHVMFHVSTGDYCNSLNRLASKVNDLFAT